MINDFFSLSTYLILNGAIAISYLIAQAMLNLAVYKVTLAQKQRLKFTRYTFLTMIVAFLLIPPLTTLLPSTYQSSFQLQPFIKNASALLLQNHPSGNNQLQQIDTVEAAILSINLLLIIAFAIGASLFLAKYSNNIFTLRKIQHNSFCRYKTKNLHILFNQEIAMPFCWSLLRKNFIAIPTDFLAKQADLKLAIYHELQHIRQGDTYWLQLLNLMQIICFWNPFIILWRKKFDELQEFSCDETLVLHKKISPLSYAQCLVSAASAAKKSSLLPQGALGINKSSQTIFYRRINMLFNYTPSNKKSPLALAAYFIVALLAVSTAYAYAGSSPTAPLTTQQIATIITHSHLDKSFQITPTPEVVKEINDIRSSKQARTFMQDSLRRMQQYKPMIVAALKQNAMPTELLAIPLVESGYQPLEQSKNPFLAAGIWQIIPSTGQRLGLTINAKQDDRFNTQLATTAALQYLKENYTQFNNWKLAVIAYEYGEKQTAQLINTVGSKDAWTLARSSRAFKNLQQFNAMFDAAVIIMNNPKLIS